MIATSAEFQASITQRTKREVSVKVDINYTDPFVDQSIVVTSSGESNCSHISQVVDGIYYPTHNWFPLDGSAVLDGTFMLMPPTSDTLSELSMEMGWWSDDVAEAGGTFATAQTLTVVFASRAIERLLVCGDSIKDEYPVDFTITLYDDTDAVLHTETVTGNTLNYWSANITSVSAVVKQTLSITKWSHVGRCAKIYEFFTALKRTYYGDEVFSLELLEERQSESASIPIGNISSNQLTLRLHNKERQFDYGSASPLASLAKPMRKIEAFIGAAGVAGVTEWVPLGTFWTQEWNIPDEDIGVDTVGFDLLSLMAETEYSPGLQTGLTWYDMFEDICQDYGLLSSMYFIDPALDSDVTPYAYLDKTSHRETLRIVAEASLASVYVDRYGVLRIEGVDYLRTTNTASQRTITASEYFTRSNPSRFSNIKNVIKVKYSPLVPDVSASEVYTADDISIASGEVLTLTVNYSDTPVIDAAAALVAPPSGITVTNVTYYPWGADIEITNASGSSAVIELEVNAKVLRVTGGGVATSSDESSISEFGEKVFEFPDNPLIQDATVAYAIANAVLTVYSTPRRDLKQSWRGDPALELSDKITTDASRTTTEDFWLIRQELSFDGTLRDSHDGILVVASALWLTEDGYIWETEDGYLWEVE
jgi:hypothetical protein